MRETRLASPVMRPSFGALVLACALAALGLPLLAVACDLTPSAVPTSASTASGSGGGGPGGGGHGGVGGVASAAGGHGGASTSTSGHGGHGGAGGHPGTGGQTTASGSAGSTGNASSSSGASMMDAGDAGDAGDAAVPVVCDTTVSKFAVDPSPHIPECFPVMYSTNPPTSGPHYPLWAAFQTYKTPVPQGFYVHDLEHGAVVITYNCPGGCDAELAALQAFLDARPADPLCTAPVKFRHVVTPDPHLDVRFAASAWGWALKSKCFDLAVLGPFMDAHYAHGPENFCFDGTDVSSPDAGVPSTCGQPVADAGGQ